MHKRLFNQAVIEYTVIPDGPILIKAGEGGADPTRPDMEFVRTPYAGRPDVPYLPGSSLKGVLRAHCERILRTLQETLPRDVPPLSCNPVKDGSRWGRDDFACNKYFERKDVKEDIERLAKGGQPEGATVFRRSCFICQLFGNTSLAGHLRTADAYPLDVDQVRTEERDGVAIDRVFGAVAVGPFQLEVVTQGEFATRLNLKNFTVAQLGLVALALRDLKAGRVGVGFGKSRGLGQVTARFDRLEIQYPTWSLLEREPDGTLPGVAALVGEEMAGAYGYVREDGSFFGYRQPADDVAALPQGVALADDGWLGAVLELTAESAIEAVWRACMPAWKKAVGL
jgi:CRISPR-associated RAMP protein (TIGR02581 family)